MGVVSERKLSITAPHRTRCDSCLFHGPKLHGPRAFGVGWLATAAPATLSPIFFRLLLTTLLTIPRQLLL